MCFNPFEDMRRRQLVLLFEIAYLMTRIAQAEEERKRRRKDKGGVGVSTGYTE
jgi:hypothetical protein